MSITATSPPQLTVVLSTYNRAETLRRTLDCLGAQDLPAGTFDILVVDDGSPDNTAEIVAEKQSTLSVPVSYLRHDNRGPGYTQNRGIQSARAPLILLMADDIFFAPCALRAHLEMHRAHPDPAVAVLGHVVQSPELIDSVFLRHWDPFQMRKIEHETELPYFMFWACNISVKRNFLLENGLFREPKGRGGAPAHEDVELGYRLSRRGLRIHHCLQASAEHYHLYTLEQAINRYYQRGLNWDEFRQYVPDPEFMIHTHLLTLDNLAEYRKVLRDPNTLIGPDRSLTRHLLRYALRKILFNRITVPMLWRPLIDAAETRPLAARAMSSRLYAAFLFYHFLRGIHDAKALYSTTRATGAAST